MVAQPGAYGGQPLHGHLVIVSGDAVVPLEAAGQAAMHDGLLAVRSGEPAHRRHGGTAGAGPVAGRAPIDVARVETVRAVVALAAAAGERPHHRFAVAAAKRL